MTNARSSHGETTLQAQTSLIYWKSVAAGLLFSVFIMTVVTFIGVSILGISANADLSRADSGTVLTVASLTGVWLIVSFAISIFIGSYIVSRVANIHSSRVGAMNGAMTAVVVMLLSLWGGAGAVAGLGSGIGNLAKSISTGVGDVSQNNFLQQSVQDAIGDTKLKDNPKDVARGLLTRIVDGDTDGIKKYFTYETGMTAQEADAKLNSLRESIEPKLQQLKEKTAHAVVAGSLALAVIMLISLLAGSVGGLLATKKNVNDPLTHF